jgi:hypothetical protein
MSSRAKAQQAGAQRWRKNQRCRRWKMAAQSGSHRRAENANWQFAKEDRVQEKASIKMPPSVGPTTMPIDTTVPNNPNALRAGGGTLR